MERTYIISDLVKELVKSELFPNSTETKENLFSVIYKNNIPTALKELALNDYLYNSLFGDIKAVIRAIIFYLKDYSIVPTKAVVKINKDNGEYLVMLFDRSDDEVYLFGGV